MLRLSLLVASALLLSITSCGGPPDGDALQSGRAAPPAAPTATQQPENTATPGETAEIEPAATLPPDSSATGKNNAEAISAVVTAVTPTTTPTPAGTATPTPTPSSTPAVTITVVPPQPTATPTETASLTPPTPQPTATATPTPEIEPTVTPTPTPTPTRTPIPAAVFVRSHTSYALGPQLIVVGELLNGAAFDVFDVRVHGRFFNSGGSLIATAEVRAAFAKLEIERPAPFRMIVDIDPDAVYRYELTVSFEEISISEYREPEVSAVAIVERNGRMLLLGSLHNGHENALSSVVVAATFYGEGGEVVDVVESFLGDEVISPGADFAFEIPLPGTGRMYARVLVLAQGRLSLF